MLNLLAVYGSPRKDGNSSLLLDWFLEGVEAAAGVEHCRIERVHLRELDFGQCTECGGCGETGVCRVRDGMSVYYGKLLTWERIVLAFPVFFLGPPALTKAFIDRAQSLWVRRYVVGIKPEGAGFRKGFLLSVGGFGGGGTVFSCNRSIVRAFYQSCGFKYAGELFVPGVDHYREIEKVEGIRETAREAGGKFVRD